MKKEIKVRLGRKLSEIINQAVTDAKRVQRVKGYKLNMGHWHTPVSGTSGDGPECHVCMAGATLVCRSDVRKAESVSLQYSVPGDRSVNSITKAKLQAIDNVRTGHVLLAAQTLRSRLKPTAAQRKAIDAAETLIIRTFTSRDGGRAPWHVYTKAAALLEAVGL